MLDLTHALRHNLMIETNCMNPETTEDAHYCETQVFKTKDFTGISSMRQERGIDSQRHASSLSSFLNGVIFLSGLPAAPRLSGFLKIKTSRTSSISMFSKWKERWCLLIPQSWGVIIQYYRSQPDSLSTIAKQVCIDIGHRAVPEPQLLRAGRFCFSFATSAEGRVVVATTSEFQMGLWMSCINSS